LPFPTSFFELVSAVLDFASSSLSSTCVHTRRISGCEHRIHTVFHVGSSHCREENQSHAHATFCVTIRHRTTALHYNLANLARSCLGPDIEISWKLQKVLEHGINSDSNNKGGVVPYPALRGHMGQGAHLVGVKEAGGVLILPTGRALACFLCSGLLESKECDGR
jgi:hypothetical protein